MIIVQCQKIDLDNDWKLIKILNKYRNHHYGQKKSYGDYMICKENNCFFPKQGDTITAASINRRGFILLYKNALQKLANQ